MKRLILAAVGSMVLAACNGAPPPPVKTDVDAVPTELPHFTKDFLIQPAEDGATDPGWVMKATVVRASTPNPLGPLNLFTGVENGGALVRFRITQDALEMVDLRELSASNPTRDPAVLDMWPATHVAIRTRVELDAGIEAHITEETQQGAWSLRPQIKVDFARGGVRTLKAFAEAQPVLARCADLSGALATVEPGSVNVDEANGYFQFRANVMVPVRFDDPACVSGYGESGRLFTQLGRSTETFTVMYSFARPHASAVALQIGEKDPIRRKYGTLDQLAVSRDPMTGLISASPVAARFDPAKPIVFYFAPGFPEELKDLFAGANGVAAQTNTLFASAGAAARLTFLNANDAQALGDGAAPAAREFGDVRYNFVRWEPDLDTGSPFAGATQLVTDPRTGEVLSATVLLPDFAVRDELLARLDFYLTELGADPALVNGEWPAGPAGCLDGDTLPFSPSGRAQFNSSSPLYARLQTLLHVPATAGARAPSDFIPAQADDDLYGALARLLPTEVYADPAANRFTVDVTRPTTDALEARASLRSLLSQLERGEAPVASAGVSPLVPATQLLENLQVATLAQRDRGIARHFSTGLARFDTVGVLSPLRLFQRDARHCRNGAWETRAEYVDALVRSTRARVAWHEMGHALGLDHNFMGSVDRANYPHYTDGAARDHVGLYSSSVMDESVAEDRAFWGSTTGRPGWAPYDQGALAFLYGNTQPSGPSNPAARSGQLDATHPWNDPLGFTGPQERQFFYCGARHLRYTPFCREDDFGSTPSEIIASEIERYEWSWRWRNFRLYRRSWDTGDYGEDVARQLNGLRRFIATWRYDWTPQALPASLARVGVPVPAGTTSSTYYTQLAGRFTAEISTAHQLAAAFEQALIELPASARAYQTQYDPSFGDVTQQGIFLDKLFAIQALTALWPAELDPARAQGTFVTSYSVGDAAYQATVRASVGAIAPGHSDMYAFARPLAVTQLAQATHQAGYDGPTDVRAWVMGKAFTNERDFLDFFRSKMVELGICPLLVTCTYDPRVPRMDSTDVLRSDSDHAFSLPDGHSYDWAYVPDRGAWVAADRDVNGVAFQIVRDWVDETAAADPSAQSPNAPIRYWLDTLGL